MRPHPDSPWLQLWGVPQLWPAGGAVAQPFGPERRYQLLVLLALQPGQWVERDRVAATLWPGHEPAEARRNLRKVLHRARALAGTQGLEATEHALRWPIATDLQAFESAARAGDTARALAWRVAPPLDGVDEPENGVLAEVLAAERSRIEQAWLALAVADMRAQSTPASRAVAARRVLAVDGLDEAAMHTALLAELQQGHVTEAQAAYRRYAARLAQELGVEPARALRDLMHGAAAASADARETAAPAPADDGFVGRRLELAEARQQLARPDARCLTLLGPGGIGKSRLAQQLMPGSAGLFPGGAHWVELVDTATLAAALARLAQVLDATLQDTGDLVQQLLRQLPRQRTLVVLDNAEHLPELGPLLQRLLAGAPSLVLLVTSRQRLNLDGEWTLPLAGLAVPDEDSRDFEAATSFDAVRLFERHAMRARRDFALAPHLDAVIRIVEAVAGLPLAIELAAAWVRLLPPEQVAQDLQGGIDLLERDPALPGQPARPEHASLRAVLEGSWQLLAPRERVALGALSVFRGGFTRAAALAVAGCSLPLLSSLVDKSLLAVDEAGRFALHPVVAAYAAERDAEEPERAATGRTRHAEFYARLWASLAPHARSDPRPLVDGVNAEFANARAAWQHAAALRRADLVDAMVITWRTGLENQGRLVEGIELLRLALDLPAATVLAQQAVSKLRHALSTLFYRKGDLHEARAIAEDALALAEQCGERGALRGCLGNIGLCLWHAGQPADALPRFERALALARADGDRHGIATSLSHVAIAEKALGRYEAALGLNLQALAMERELGNQRGVASKLNNIGNLHRALGQWDEAHRWFTEGLHHCREYGLAAAAPFLQLNLGLTETELGRLGSAQAHLQAVMAEMRDAGQLQVQLSAELGLARIHLLQGEDAATLERLCRVADLAQTKAFHTHPVQAASIYGEWLAGRGRQLEAVALWQMVVAQPALDDMDRRGVLTLIERLALTAEQRALACAALPTLEGVLTAMRAERPGGDTGRATGNGKETPPA
ncbi:MAG: tetratricopeptide repeat protein [Rubrivivax sp.]|nr:tetratricopeptide repeat protein [Rubrivivax sp.]